MWCEQAEPNDKCGMLRLLLPQTALPASQLQLCPMFGSAPPECFCSHNCRLFRNDDNDDPEWCWYIHKNLPGTGCSPLQFPEPEAQHLCALRLRHVLLRYGPGGRWFVLARGKFLFARCTTHCSVCAFSLSVGYVLCPLTKSPWSIIHRVSVAALLVSYFVVYFVNAKVLCLRFAFTCFSHAELIVIVCRTGQDQRKRSTEPQRARRFR